MGKLVSINISKEKGTVKKPVLNSEVIKDYGLENDAHAGNWHRQVSLLCYESFRDFEKRYKRKLEYGAFGENLLISGIDFSEIKVGTVISVGETELEVTQIGKLCHKGCEIREIVGECIMSSEGVFAKVLKAGKIQEGDEVCIMSL